ncbi:hypothetical protein JTE90_021930, partial [Oedothorax gibbosus]
KCLKCWNKFCIYNYEVRSSRDMRKRFHLHWSRNFYRALYGTNCALDDAIL